jgi:hypothetical protein
MEIYPHPSAGPPVINTCSKVLIDHSLADYINPKFKILIGRLKKHGLTRDQSFYYDWTCHYSISILDDILPKNHADPCYCNHG